MLRYRLEHDLLQTELGSTVGVSQPYVAKLERGDQPPSLATLARLAQRLGLESPIAVTPTTVLSPCWRTASEDRNDHDLSSVRVGEGPLNAATIQVT